MLQRLKDLGAPLRRRLALGEAYRRAFGTPDGERVLVDLMREGGLLEPAHVEGDPHSTAWRDGRRSMLLHILDRMRWTEGQYLHLVDRLTEEEAAGPAVGEA